MKIGLTGIDWTRIGISIFLVALSAFCALQSVISGMAYGAVVGVHDMAGQAAELQHRGQRFLLACLLLQGLTALVLGPALRNSAGTPDDAYDLGKWGRYLIAFIISIFSTVVGLGALIWVLKKS
jgi:hypothetical protein